MELIAASQIVRSLNRMTANRAYRAGMARIVVEAAKGDPAAAAKLLGTPEEIHRVVVLAVVADRGLSGPYNSSVLRATERLVGQAAGRRRRRPALHRRQEGPVVLPLPRPGRRAGRSSGSASDRPSADAREVAAAVASPFTAGDVDQVLLVSTRYRSAGSQVAEVHQLLPLPDPSEAADRRGRRGRPDGPGAERRRRATPSSSPTSRHCWPSWPPRPSSPRSSPRCWRARPPSSPPSSGRWRPPATTPTS